MSDSLWPVRSPQADFLLRALRGDHALRSGLSRLLCVISGRRDRRSLDEIRGWFEYLADVAPRANIQLSGGEPALRDDLPAVIALGRDHGFLFFQLNTNGVRLARDADYVKGLAEAGLSTAFLQFDGVSEAPYQVLRGASLFTTKMRAIEACAEAGLGVVLVPTLVPGVNMHEVGAIVDLAVANTCRPSVASTSSPSVASDAFPPRDRSAAAHA